MRGWSKIQSFRHVSAVSVMLGVGGMASPAWAGSVSAGVEATLSTRVMSNPFNVAVSPGAAVAISPQISPWLIYEDPNTNIDARAVALVDQYSGGYGRNSTGSANVSVEQRMSDRFTLHGGANYVNSNSGVHDVLLNRTTPADQVIPPGTPPIDVSSAGLRTRFQNLNARVGGGYALSALDSVSLDFASTLSRSSAAGSSDFFNGSAIFGYSRKVSARTSAQLSVQYVKVDYFKTDAGDSSLVSPQVGITQQLTGRLGLQVSVGATIVRLKKIPGQQITGFNIVSGSFRLCETIPGGALCLSGSRSAQPTTLGGLSASQDVMLAIDKRISEADVLNITGHYARIAQKDSLAGFSQDVVGVLANLSHKFTPRFNGFVTPSYSKAFGGLVARGDNYEMRVSVVYRFGALR